MKISPSEGRILEVLWEAGRPLANDEVFAALGDDAGWSAGTVRNFLARLVKKKAVGTRLDGRRYLFSPLIARGAYVHAQTKDLLDRLFDGQVGPMLAHFSQHQELTDEEIADLRTLIEG